MANFDALRSAIIGPLEYICKPAPPAELICCYPFSGAADPSGISTMSTNGVIQNPSTKAWFGTGLYSDGVISSTVSLTRSLDLSLPWSLEFLLAGTDAGKLASGLNFTIGDLNFQSSAYFTKLIIKNGSTTLYEGWSGEGPQQTAFGLTYDGTTIRYYVSGSLQKSFTTQFSGIIKNFSFYSANYQSAHVFVTDFRIVQKQIGTASAFPIPTSLYTGYEAL